MNSVNSKFAVQNPLPGCITFTGLNAMIYYGTDTDTLHTESTEYECQMVTSQLTIIVQLDKLFDS